MIIPWEMINCSTLNNLIESRVSSEGNDNGDLSTLEDRVSQVMEQLKNNKIVIVFDEITETFTIVNREGI